MLPILALELALIGCGDNRPGPLASGDRLELLWWLYEAGGAERERGRYYDADLAAPCTPTRWSDGATYCMPEAVPAIFVDSTCTTALATVAAGQVAPDFTYRTYFVGERPYPSRLFRIGAPADVPTERWERRDGFCYGPYQPDGSATYRELGEAIDIARVRYVATSERDGFRIESATSDDGLVAAERVIDTTLDVPCAFAPAANQTTATCAPRDAPLPTLYADAACSVLGVAAPQRPKVAMQHDGGSHCDRYFLVGDEVPALYARGAGTCDAVTPSGSYFAIAGELQLPSIARLPAGTDRLQTIALGALPIEDPLLHDTATGADCRREQVDDEHYCLPAGTSRIEHLFTDGGCTQRIAIAIVPQGGCAHPGPFARDQRTFHEILERHTAPLFVRPSGGTCGLLQLTGSFAPHDVGPAIPFSAFPRATLAHGPRA